VVRYDVGVTGVCPTDQLVADFVARRAPAAVASEVEAHIDVCDVCRELVSLLAQGTVPASARGAHPLEGTQIGRFTVAERLGAGGMGAVYAAHDPVLDRRVAVKVLHDPSVPGAAWSGRLLREAQALARLAHANVVAVYDVGEHDDQIFVAMELVQGTTLGQWLALKPRRWDAIVDMFVQAGRGLAAAHDAGFVHRDFKPDNVLVGEDGRARVTDFGLARLGDTPDAPPPPQALVEDLTRTGTVVGTPAYMAPEQIDGAATDARADQFAFCVALAEALGGERPFRGDHIVELRAAMAMGEMRPLETDAPAHVVRAIRRGLAEDPAARHPDMRALLAALTDVRGRRTRRGAVAALSLAAVAMIGWRVGRTGRATGVAADPCGGAEAVLAGVWDAPRRDVAHAAFTATGVPYAEDSWKSAEHSLAAWTGAWSAARRDACEDSAVRREQSGELLDRRMSCLDDALDDVRALSDAFAAADRAAVEHAVAAASGLPDLAVCADRDALMSLDGPPADPAMRAQVDAIERRLATANAQWRTGKVREAVAALAGAATDAAATGHAPTLARAQVGLGTAQAALDEAAAQATLRSAHGSMRCAPMRW
jgi:eukaryotic-like serine/threonine-protein kinase